MQIGKWGWGFGCGGDIQKHSFKRRHDGPAIDGCIEALFSMLFQNLYRFRTTGWGSEIGVDKMSRT